MTSSALFENDILPAYGAIKLEDIRPAFDAAMEEARAVIKTLRESNEEPSFQNTVLPLDTVFDDVSRVFKIVSNYFNGLRMEGVSDLLAELQEAYDVFSKDLYQDSVIAARFKTVYDQKDSLGLDAQDLWFLEAEYSAFEESGSVLAEAGQKRLREIDAALIQQAKAFNDNLEGGIKQQSFLITDPAELEGLSAKDVAAMAKQAEKAKQTGWLFMPERLLVDRLLGEAANRGFRQKILAAMDSVGKIEPYNNRPVVEAMHRLRHERATLLGYTSYAQSALSGTMAGSVERVVSLFDVTLEAAIPAFNNDMVRLQEWVTNEKNGPVMEPWDVSYYTALYKKEKLSFDEAAFSEYLELENVLQGWLLHASKSMNIGFVETKAYPVWHPDVRVYETIDYDSGKKGLFYLDLYTRDQKEGGAWMDCLQVGEAAVGRPNIISFNMNLAKSLDGSPVLLSIGDLETSYHEGGHCLNGIKGTETKYRSRQGTANTSDFVEIHSMIDENWATHPDVLATYAFHYKTGALIPRELLKARDDSNNFMASADLLRMLQNARRDMIFHATPPDQYGSDETIEAKAALNTPYSSHVRPYPLTRFYHMFTDALSDYAAGYYGYFFSDMAQAAAFELFDTQGVYHSTLTARKRAFYAIGGGLEPNAAYEAFTGFPAGNPKPLLAGKGIVIQEPATQGGAVPAGQPEAPELNL